MKNRTETPLGHTLQYLIKNFGLNEILATLAAIYDAKAEEKRVKYGKEDPAAGALEGIADRIFELIDEPEGL